MLPRVIVPAPPRTTPVGACSGCFYHLAGAGDCFLEAARRDGRPVHVDPTWPTCVAFISPEFAALGGEHDDLRPRR